ncbi:MAG TPA: hypothetical protein VN256_02895 [Pyrinomonadaceae bacterium]|nr:hypothetical protein [Pyrinomonadaceae bacterium]
MKVNKKLTSAGRINRRRRVEGGGPQPWWKMSRRTFNITAVAATVGVIGGAAWLLNRDDTSEIDGDSLELQRTHGWDIGSEDKRLTFAGAQGADSQQGAAWRRYLNQSEMLNAFQPKSQKWLPYFVPTLIQALQFESLRNQLTPVFSPEMQEAYGRGQAIAKDFLKNAENPSETAIIVDVPGRQSVALGAGLSEDAHLVTTFDNFPHPLGVTPSHETLAAMLYYAGEIESKQANVPQDAPPVFLLDSRRLENYTDADTQFDNRYLAKIPSAEKLKELGVNSVLYVTPDRTRQQELDDLNEDFVEYQNQGLNVAMLPLSDLTGVDEWAEGKRPDGTTGQVRERHYYYGGGPAFHPFFFYSYPFYRPTGTFVSRYPQYGSVAGGRAPAGFAPPVTPPRYIPATRPTMFAGTRVGAGARGGVGRSKPSGFGRTTVRMASGGAIVGTRAGRSGYYSPRRSGSFGRSRGGSYGG